VSATTFFHDPAGRPWKDADAFRDASMSCVAFSQRRTQAFETRYYVGLDPEDSLRLPTKKPTTRTMRHTCITLSHVPTHATDFPVRSHCGSHQRSRKTLASWKRID
jgi:hypothetical protein